MALIDDATAAQLRSAFSRLVSSVRLVAFSPATADPAIAVRGGATANGIRFYGLPSGYEFGGPILPLVEEAARRGNGSGRP